MKKLHEPPILTARDVTCPKCSVPPMMWCYMPGKGKAFHQERIAEAEKMTKGMKLLDRTGNEEFFHIEASR
jgi:hypothetical protein